jgi:hypothetical protein
MAGMQLRGGNRKSKSRDVTLNLDSLGIEAMQSHRWQRIASIPDSVFETRIAAFKPAKSPATAIHLIMRGPER